MQHHLPELVKVSPQGGTIHKYQLSGGKSLFMRFLTCYLGSCKFCRDMEEATTHLACLEKSMSSQNGHS